MSDFFETIRQCNQGLIGINANLLVTEGYDGRMQGAELFNTGHPFSWGYGKEVYVRDPLDKYEVEEFLEQSFSKAEKHVLADEMIRRWTEYKSKIDNDPDPNSPTPRPHG